MTCGKKSIAIRRWDSDAVWRRYGLHRFPAGHKPRPANRQGDHRALSTPTPARSGRIKPPDEILNRLEWMRVGPQISRMIVGALYDTKQISEAGDLKADIHVRRVLGRVFAGDRVLCG